MRSPEHIVRHIIRCDWRCKHCREIFGSERIAHYGTDLPDLIKPTWFFASMALLDHLRDCPGINTHSAAGYDFSDELRTQYGEDFLNHPQIHAWYNVHGLVERHFLAQEELE
jgi:hypothetical protein